MLYPSSVFTDVVCRDRVVFASEVGHVPLLLVLSHDVWAVLSGPRRVARPLRWIRV
jgi:hypothetical protein